jgi:N-acetyl sugar amidotransferase
MTHANRLGLSQFTAPDGGLSPGGAGGRPASLPERRYQICASCVMDVSDPGISFDDAGVCAPCRDFRLHVAPFWDTGPRGRERLDRTIDAIKKAGRGKEFDSLLGVSGGLDSSYMLHVMVREFGLRPLVFHVDGGWNSELAVHNINALIDGLGVDLYTEVIDWTEMREFQLAWFRAGVPHLDIPQDHAFVATLYKFAEQHDIKYIFNGGNLATECVRYPKDLFYYGTDMRHIRDIISRFCSVPIREYPFSSVFRHKIYLRFLRGVRVVKPLNFLPYIQKPAVETLVNEYAWRPYPQKHFESRFTRFYEGYWLPHRFGFDPRRVQLSSLVLTGQVTRPEALEALSRPTYCAEDARRDMEFVSAKLGISEDQLTAFLDMPRKYYWDYKNREWLIDIGGRVLSMLHIDRALTR